MVDKLDPLGAEFVDVTTVLNPGTAAKTSPAGGTLSRSGRFTVNTEGTGLVDLVANNSDLPDTHYWTKFRVNMANKTVAITTVDSTTNGAVEVRRSADGRSITLYLHGVFKDHPDLRPTGDSQVKMTMHPSGKAVLISLACGGLGMRHSKRGSGQESNTQK